MDPHNSGPQPWPPTTVWSATGAGDYTPAPHTLTFDHVTPERGPLTRLLEHLDGYPALTRLVTWMRDWLRHLAA